MRKIKFLGIMLFILLISANAFAVAPDINVTAPIGETLYSHRQITIDFNIFDADTDAIGMLFDFNFSTTAEAETGTVIVKDLNGLLANCDSTDFSTTSQCSFSFTFSQPSAPASGSYFIVASARDDSDTTHDANGSFNFIKLSKEDTLCATISDDLAQANGCIDDDGLEDTVTSGTGMFVLEGGDSSSLMWLTIVGFLIIVIAGFGIALYIKGMKAVKKT